MNPNWLGLFSMMGSFVAFRAVYLLTLKKPRKLRVALAIGSVLMAIPAISFSLYYVHWFPVPAWYYEFRSVIGTELLLLVLGVAGGSVATILPRRLLIAPLLGVVLFSIIPFIKPFVGPISDDAYKTYWVNDVCIQSTPSTCGAASLATVLNSFGIEMSESKIAEKAYTYQGGTEAWYLARVAKSHGCDVRFEIASGFVPEGDLPAIVGVSIGHTGHFIAILGKEADLYVVGEPLSGRKLMSIEQLLERYQFTGFHMRLRKSAP